MDIHFNTQLKTLEANNFIFSKKSLARKPHLLLFYHTQCLGCTGRAIPLAYQFQQDYPELQVLLIHTNLGSSKPSTAEILSVFVEGKSPLPIYIDEKAELHHQFKCEGTPHWILLNEAAEVQNSIFGSQANAQNRLMYSLDQLSNVD